MALRDALRPPKCTIFTGHTKGVWEINYSYGSCAMRSCPAAPPPLPSS